MLLLFGRGANVDRCLSSQIVCRFGHGVSICEKVELEIGSEITNEQCVVTCVAGQAGSW
jgi:hypothetical protein